MMNSDILERRLGSFLPQTAVLELTYNCNHNCIFCSCPWFAADGRFEQYEELNLAQWQAVITKLCSYGVTNFAFTGGEATLKAGLTELIEFTANCDVENFNVRAGKLATKRQPPKLFLLSNGCELSDEILTQCMKHNVRLSLSLPGLETFQTHTGSSYSAEQLLNCFSRAQALGIYTTVGVTVTKLNQHELFTIISHALLAGANQLLLNRFLPGGRGLARAAELMLNADEVIKMLYTAEEVLALAGRQGNVGTELPLGLVDCNEFNHLQIGSQCGGARDFFVIDPSGYIRVCNHSEVRLNHIDDLDNLVNNEYWQYFAGAQFKLDVCQGCHETGHCAGGCREAAHILYGSLDATDPLTKSCSYLNI